MAQGYTTTEFYLTVASMVVGILVAKGVVDPAQASQLTQSIMTIVGGLIALVPVVTYIINRTWLKSKQPATPTAPIQ